MISAWASAASGIPDSGTQGDVRVQWAESNLPRPELPYVSLRRLGSGSAHTQERILSQIPTVNGVTILTDVVGTSAAITLNYGGYRYAVQPGDSLTDVRDGLIAELVDGPDALSVAVLDAVSFRVAGLGVGLAYPLGAVEGVSVAPATVQDVQVTETTRTTTVRVELFGFDDPDDRALDYADAMIADIGRAVTARTLAERGVSVVGNRPTAQDTSALSGAARETRAFFDLQVAQCTRHTTADPAAVASVESPPFVAGVDLLREGAA